MPNIGNNEWSSIWGKPSVVYKTCMLTGNLLGEKPPCYSSLLLQSLKWFQLNQLCLSTQVNISRKIFACIFWRKELEFLVLNKLFRCTSFKFQPPGEWKDQINSPADLLYNWVERSEWISKAGRIFQQLKHHAQRWCLDNRHGPWAEREIRKIEEAPRFAVDWVQ